MLNQSSKRARLAERSPSKSEKRWAGATDAAETPVLIRDVTGGREGAGAAWVHERLGRQLGKFARQIERVHVRFDDVNGTKGGLDCSCMVQVVLSALPPVVVEVLGETEREAFDLAAGRAERATRRVLEKHGFSVGHKRRNRPHEPSVASALEGDGMDTKGDGMSEAPPESDTAIHTAHRNLKDNESGMAYALEDSANGKASRKSTRRSANHVKHANGLTLRTKSAVLSPKSVAARSASRGY